MSIQNLAILGRLPKNKSTITSVLGLTRSFSRKCNTPDSSYKVLKPKGSVKGKNKLTSLDPNFETLAPTSSFPFILHGNVGIGWYNLETTSQFQHEFSMEQIDADCDMNRDIVCRVQTCPTLLRQTVCDLFPYLNLESSELSVVTISLKSDLKSLRKQKEIETERMAQMFVVIAKSVCDKLRKSGYWADFVNPFSGRPYLVPHSHKELYEADEKFRCLDFQIFDIKNCKIISNEDNGTSSKRFIGSLFTNAASKKNHLNDIFTKN